MKRILIVLVVAVALGGLFIFGLTNTSDDRDIKSNKLDKPVPAFELPLYERYQSNYGDSLNLKDYQGKPIIINFWASWCGPCYQEAPELELAWQKYQDEALFIGIQTQDKGKVAEGEAFIEQFDLSFPNGLDDNSRIGIEYGLFGVPETFFVRADGTLAHKHTGPVTMAVIDEQLRAMQQ